MKNPRCYLYSNDACHCPPQVHDPHFTSLVKEERFTSLLGEAWGTEDVSVLQSMALHSWCARSAPIVYPMVNYSEANGSYTLALNLLLPCRLVPQDALLSLSTFRLHDAAGNAEACTTLVGIYLSITFYRL